MIRNFALLLVGVFAGSTAVIMIQACAVHPALLAFYRLAIAVVALAPLFLRDLRRHGAGYNAAALGRTVLPGLMLAAHFITWNLGARQTLAANASLIVNMVPVVMPFLLHFLVREKLTAGEWMATVLAMTGIFVLAGADFHLSPEHFQGDVICFASMLCFALYLAMGRRSRQYASIWLYVVPLYTVAAIACFAASLFYVSPLAIDSTKDLLIVLAMGVLPTVIGHSILNVSMKRLRGQTVSVANLGQFVFAGAMAYYFYDQAPRWTFYASAVLVVTGAVLAVRSAPPGGAIAEKR